MLGEDIVVFAFMFYLCFLFHIWYIDFDLYYEIISGIYLFILCFVKSRSLYYVYLYFPHMRLCICLVFQEFIG